MGRKYDLKLYQKTYSVEIIPLKYSVNNNLAIRLITREGPFATITVNIEDLPEGYAYLDTNNCPWAEEFVTKNSLGAFTGEYVTSGFCEYPLYKFDKYAIENFK